MLQKKAIKSQKRKQQADEKREIDKKRTMERLLKKHESKSKTNAKNRLAKKNVNNIVYISKDDKVSLLFPKDVDFPLKSSSAKYVYHAIVYNEYKYIKLIILTLRNNFKYFLRLLLKIQKI